MTSSRLLPGTYRTTQRRRELSRVPRSSSKSWTPTPRGKCLMQTSCPVRWLSLTITVTRIASRENDSNQLSNLVGKRRWSPCLPSQQASNTNRNCPGRKEEIVRNQAPPCLWPRCKQLTWFQRSKPLLQLTKLAVRTNMRLFASMIRQNLKN